MDLLKYLFVIHCLFKVAWANLKTCSENHDEQAVCLKEVYIDPFPIMVTTYVYLKEIIGIDENKNSIGVGVKLVAKWTDPRISLTNNSVE